MTDQTPPRWDLTNIYPDLDSSEYQSSFAQLKDWIAELRLLLEDHQPVIEADTNPDDVSPWIRQVIDRLNAIRKLGSTLQAYLYGIITTDSYNTHAARRNSEFDQVWVQVEILEVQFQALVGRAASLLPEIVKSPGTIRQHQFYLEENARQSQYLMSPAEESLASQLSLSGANAWNKLQGVVTSQITVDFELKGKLQKLPMPALINLYNHPDEAVRRRAYETEIKTWDTVREPLTAAMNGIKGTEVILNKRRGRQDALHSALDLSRIDRSTIQAMLDAMQASFPQFRKYFKKKASRMGKKQLAWWDIFAPSVFQTEDIEQYTFSQARDFILANFARFSPDLEAFARQAFEKGWIDAEQRDGKRGGAFCMDVPGVGESRILCNFDGSLDQVFTIAHELGHGFHNYCIHQAGKTELQSRTPMTLAETASIMCETIVLEAALSGVSSPGRELAILETSLISAAQVIVDIYSRYVFEKEVMQRREQAELSADELCELMENAQKQAYGDALDERYLHKYMWTWKPHYYYPGQSFYNYPYAFGLLFGTGLYSIYQQRGEAFIPDYKKLLSNTGEGTAAELAARFNIDITQRAFWEGSLQIIGRRIDQYLAIE